MKNYVVLGAQFGDEGKGKLLDWLMSMGDICIRFNGGSNAGHTIAVNNVKYHTHVLPSGLIHNDKLNIMGSGMVIGLDNLLSEIHDLTSKGINIGDRLLISDRAHIVLSAHKELDSVNGGKIGTTKQGIGPAYSSKSNRTGLRVCDILSDEWQSKLEKCYKQFIYYFDEETLTRLINKDIKDISKSRNILINSAINLVDYIHKLSDDKIIIFEGANATMLDINHGTYPFVTSSLCTISGVFAGTGMNPSIFYKNEHEIIGVMKAYITRVGNGKLVSESHKEGGIMQKIGKEFGVTTNRMRRCGWLDLVQMKYSNLINGFTHLNITKLDVLSEFETVYIVHKYKHTITGEYIDYYPADENELNLMEPIYMEFKGWKGCDISMVKKYDDLPENVKKYICEIENILCIPIKYINTGQERTQMVIKED